MSTFDLCTLILSVGMVLSISIPTAVLVYMKRISTRAPIKITITLGNRPSLVYVFGGNTNASQFIDQNGGHLLRQISVYTNSDPMLVLALVDIRDSISVQYATHKSNPFPRPHPQEDIFRDHIAAFIFNSLCAPR